MIIKSIDDVKASGGYQEKPGVWTSTRYLLKDDGVGFTLTQTTCKAGQVIEMQYKYHIEANLVVEGVADVTDMATGNVHRLSAGMMYTCLLYTSPSPRDKRQSRMPSSA